MFYCHWEIDENGKPLSVVESINKVLAISKDYDLSFEDAKFLKDNTDRLPIVFKVPMTNIVRQLCYKLSDERYIENFAYVYNISYSEAIVAMETLTSFDGL